MKKILIMLVVLSILFLSGCEERQYTLEDTLYRELESCEYKFGTDSSEKRGMNQGYCERILDEIRRYQEQNMMVDVDINITGETTPPASTEIKIEDAVNAIIGDI